MDKLGRSSHVATKTFQALRIFVNNELNELHNGIEGVHSLLRSGGVCAVISFHSLEDRIVKRLFHGIDVDAKANMSVTDRFRSHSVTYDNEMNRYNEPNKWVPLLDRKVVTASETEIQANPRARSAKLRAAQKYYAPQRITTNNYEGL